MHLLVPHAEMVHERLKYQGYGAATTILEDRKYQDVASMHVHVCGPTAPVRLGANRHGRNMQMEEAGVPGEARGGDDWQGKLGLRKRCEVSTELGQG
jgi:hypothetical protein